MTHSGLSELAYQRGLPRKRMFAGALFFDGDGRLLLVKPTYRDHWLIPGGVVDAEESPGQACRREVAEELGLARAPGRLLCVDYISASSQKTEAVGFVFFGGTLAQEEIARIKLPATELSHFLLVLPAEVARYCAPPLSNRLALALQALAGNHTIYAENQVIIG